PGRTDIMAAGSDLVKNLYHARNEDMLAREKPQHHEAVGLAMEHTIGSVKSWDADLAKREADLIAAQKGLEGTALTRNKAQVQRIQGLHDLTDAQKHGVLQSAHRIAGIQDRIFKAEIRL